MGVGGGVGYCGEYPFFRTQNKGLCSESVKECEKQLLQITRKWPQTASQGQVKE